MSRLHKLDKHALLRKDQYNPCYALDTLILTEYKAAPDQFPPSPKDVFPSEICIKVKECESCPMDHIYKWNDLMADLERACVPKPLAGLSPLGVF